MMAERVGFEPTEGFLDPHSISSRAPSSTRPPLRFGAPGGIRTHDPGSGGPCLNPLGHGGPLFPYYISPYPRGKLYLSELCLVFSEIFL